MIKKKASMLSMVEEFKTVVPEDFIDGKLSEMEEYILNAEIDNQYLVRVGLWFRKMFYFVLPTQKSGYTQAFGVPLNKREKLVPLFNALNRRFGKGEIPAHTSRVVFSKTPTERWISKAIWGDGISTFKPSENPLIVLFKDPQFKQALLEYETGLDKGKKTKKVEKAEDYLVSSLFMYPLFSEDWSQDSTKYKFGQAKWFETLKQWQNHRSIEIPALFWANNNNKIKAYAWGFRSWALTRPHIQTPDISGALGILVNLEKAGNNGDLFIFHKKPKPSEYILSADDFLEKYQVAFKEHFQNLSDDEKADVDLENPNTYFPFDFEEVLLHIKDLSFSIEKIFLSANRFDIFLS